MSCISLDINKTNDLFVNIEKELKEYDNNIDLFFKELVSNASWISNNSKQYKDYINLKMIEYRNFSESFKKFISTSRYSLTELENVINNNRLE